MGKKITEYTVTATIIEGEDLIDVSKETSPGVFESQKAKVEAIAAGILAQIYRSNTVSLTTGSNVVAFSSALPSANYELLILSLDGTTADPKTAVKTDAGFTIDVLDDGDFIYLAILTN